MPFLDTHDLPVNNRRPGWRGRVFKSETMTFAHWDFAAGSDIHEHSHEQEEVWHVLEGRLEVTIDGEFDTENLFSLIALMTRYGLDMRCLKRYCLTVDKKYFASPNKYWHDAVFKDPMKRGSR